MTKSLDLLIPLVWIPPSPASSWVDPASENEEVLKVCTYIMAVFTVIFFIFTMLMVRRLKVAIACIKVSISAFSTVPSLVIFPLIPCIAMTLMFLYWVFAGVYLMSCGDQKINDGCVHPFESSGYKCGVETEWSRELQYMLLYHFFGSCGHRSSSCAVVFGRRTSLPNFTGLVRTRWGWLRC